MPGGWRKRRLRRHLADALSPDEEIQLIERAALQGWWVLTDRTLFTVEESGTRAVLLRHIRSVDARAGTYLLVTIVTVQSQIVLGALPEKSQIAERLLALGRH